MTMSIGDILLKLEPNLVVRSDLEWIARSKLQWDQLQNKSILVTGGGGFLASYIVKSLLALNEAHDLGIGVICAVRSTESILKRLSSYTQLSNFKVVEHDISEPLPNNFPLVDIVIHSASQASPKFYGIDPVGTLKANSIGTMHLLEHAVKSKATKFLFFSSGEIYGQFKNADEEITEDNYGYVDPMLVRSCYAESKRMGETLCVSWAHQYGIHAVIVRPFHTYGPGISLNDGRVFADFVADVVAGRDINIKSDGLARRPFCYIADATLAFLTVLLSGKSCQAYNVANPFSEISMKDLAKTLVELFPERHLKLNFELPSSDAPYLKSPIRSQIPSIKKIAELGWTPSTSITDGFYKTITSFL